LFEGRFSEILIIFVLALIVLGPEKLPRVLSELGGWVGRARAMARQFREQLEEEVQREEARKRAAAGASANSSPAAGERPSASAEPSTEPANPASFAANPGNRADPVTPGVVPGDAVVRSPILSHAHPSEATGAEPPVPRAGHAPSADERTA
jgi:sec-independent protein translocase protein TatB